MKVLFIHNRYQQHGGEDVAFDSEVSLLQQKGHEIKSIVFDNTSIKGVSGKLKAGLKAIYNSNSAAKVKETLAIFHPDVIHVHNLFFVGSPSILFVARRFRIPVILTLHNYRLICANALLLRNNCVCELCVQKSLPLSGIKYKCYRKSISASAMVTAITGIHKLLRTWQEKVTTYIVLTEFAKSKLLNSSIKVPENRMVIKPNFVEDPGEGHWPRENFFLFVGRISKEKGIDMLSEAFAAMPQCNLVVVGDGPDKNLLQKQYQQHANLSFIGRLERTRVLETLKRCKALVFPSVWYEVLPFAIIEAFATGTPVIASRLGSMAEMVEDGYNGYHFIPGNVTDLQDKIGRFTNLGQQEKAIYSNARKTYFNKFHPDLHYSSIQNIYNNALARTKETLSQATILEKF